MSSAPLMNPPPGLPVRREEETVTDSPNLPKIQHVGLARATSEPVTNNSLNTERPILKSFNIALSSHQEKPPLLRILITDDNAINRKLLVAFAKKHSFYYQEAENGLQALLACQESTKPFDIILMDISMPVMDGMSATRAIRDYEQSYNIPRSYIVALTGLVSASAKLEAMNSGVDYYIPKPVNFKALQKLLNEKARKDGQTYS